ncbi:unnamed protein product [Prorocentrum cordatum]|uniref:RNA helicase n=1 Tax=Prorocentrum cordatum TaxID=2364126 RepID=A0ABN9WJV0_9DINO|nr:unnamed protein product [Polarella glacialis]
MQAADVAAAPAPTRLRGYQERLVAECAGRRSIVVLPTGAGKTLIAAELARASLPARAVRAWTGLRVGEYHGELQLPAEWDVLVATPAAFASAQAKRTELAWSSFKLVIFDEVHHVLKDHPYRKLALRLRDAPACVLGLTASLTYAVGDAAVTAAVQKLTSELRIEHMAMASVAEMRADGYHGDAAEADVLSAPGWPPAGVVPAADRKPHKMSPVFFARLKDGTATAPALGLYRCVRAMEAAVALVDRGFSSPLGRPVKEWGAYAHGRAGPLYADLEQWYEALRVLCVSWEEGADAAATFLRMRGCEAAEAWPDTVQAEVRAFWAATPAEFPRFLHLKTALLREHGRTESFRGLLFVQQRVTTHVLEYFLQRDASLRERFRPACLYATTSPATASLAVSPAQARARVAAFAAGEVNLLIATAVAEEGMDVPAANCVLRFDPMLTPVSLTQSRGRARQAGSSFVVLSERPDRPARALAAAEQQQQRIVEAFEPGAGPDPAKVRAAQEARERGAAQGLAKDDPPLAVLNLYCKRTKVDLVETWRAGACELVYASTLRTVTAVGTGADKKAAKRDAAASLVAQLRS